MGLKGINLEPGSYPEAMYADDRRLYPIYAYCEDKGIPVSVMAGGSSAGPDLSYTNPIHIDRVAGDFPISRSRSRMVPGRGYIRYCTSRSGDRTSTSRRISTCAACRARKTTFGRRTDFCRSAFYLRVRIRSSGSSATWTGSAPSPDQAGIAAATHVRECGALSRVDRLGHCGRTSMGRSATRG